MISDEKIVETKKCLCWAEFTITDWDISLLNRIAPEFLWKRYKIPTPTLCPACREARRLSFRNERNIYRTTSAATWKSILSIYSPDKDLKIYEKAEWLSDKWDAKTFWRDFDFSRTFFEQFSELVKETPKMSLTQDNSENSEFTNRTWNVKDCYLSFITWESANSHYLYWSMFTDDSIDCSYIQNSDRCYECTDCQDCHNLHFALDCRGCSDSKFLSDCVSCMNCFWCVGLRNASYRIFNEQFTKEEYVIRMQELVIDRKLMDSVEKRMTELRNTIPVKFYIWSNNENVTWNYIINSKDCEHCFDVGWETWMSSCKYCTDWGWQMSDCMDSTHWAINYSLAYECLWSMDWSKTMWTIDCWWGTSDSYYCTNSFWIRDCFWCTWLRNSTHCILNKQYTKAEYDTLVPKIIEHMQKTKEWWEFFPSSVSVFWYNETVAQEYYPLNKETALNLNKNWSDFEVPFPKVEKIIPASKLPENIKDVPDDILNWAIECELTKKPFRLIKQELEFYRKNWIPVPRRHPDRRHLDRLSLRNPRKLYDRNCHKCGKYIKTTYDLKRSEMVYCEECFNAY